MTCPSLISKLSVAGVVYVVLGISFPGTLSNPALISKEFTSSLSFGSSEDEFEERIRITNSSNSISATKTQTSTLSPSMVSPNSQQVSKRHFPVSNSSFHSAKLLGSKELKTIEQAKTDFSSARFDMGHLSQKGLVFIPPFLKESAQDFTQGESMPTPVGRGKLTSLSSTFKHLDTEYSKFAILFGVSRKVPTPVGRGKLTSLSSTFKHLDTAYPEFATLFEEEAISSPLSSSTFLPQGEDISFKEWFEFSRPPASFQKTTDPDTSVIDDMTDNTALVGLLANFYRGFISAYEERNALEREALKQVNIAFGKNREELERLESNRQRAYKRFLTQQEQLEKEKTHLKSQVQSNQIQARSLLAVKDNIVSELSWTFQRILDEANDKQKLAVQRIDDLNKEKDERETSFYEENSKLRNLISGLKQRINSLNQSINPLNQSKFRETHISLLALIKDCLALCAKTIIKSKAEQDYIEARAKVVTFLKEYLKSIPTKKEGLTTEKVNEEIEALVMSLNNFKDEEVDSFLDTFKKKLPFDLAEPVVTKGKDLISYFRNTYMELKDARSFEADDEMIAATAGEYVEKFQTCTDEEMNDIFESFKSNIPPDKHVNHLIQSGQEKAAELRDLKALLKSTGLSIKEGQRTIARLSQQIDTMQTHKKELFEKAKRDSDRLNKKIEKQKEYSESLKKIVNDIAGLRKDFEHKLSSSRDEGEMLALQQQLTEKLGATSFTNLAAFNEACDNLRANLQQLTKTNEVVVDLQNKLTDKDTELTNLKEEYDREDQIRRSKSGSYYKVKDQLEAMRQDKERTFKSAQAILDELTIDAVVSEGFSEYFQQFKSKFAPGDHLSELEPYLQKSFRREEREPRKYSIPGFAADPADEVLKVDSLYSQKFRSKFAADPTDEDEVLKISTSLPHGPILRNRDHEEDKGVFAY